MSAAVEITRADVDRYCRDHDLALTTREQLSTLQGRNTDTVAIRRRDAEVLGQMLAAARRVRAALAAVDLTSTTDGAPELADVLDRWGAGR